MKTFVLLMYLSTVSASTGMTTMVAEFSSFEKCNAAGLSAKKTFGGIYTGVYWVCAEK